MLSFQTLCFTMYSDPMAELKFLRKFKSSWLENLPSLKVYCIETKVLFVEPLPSELYSQNIKTKTFANYDWNVKLRNESFLWLSCFSIFLIIMFKYFLLFFYFYFFCDHCVFTFSVIIDFFFIFSMLLSFLSFL